MANNDVHISAEIEELTVTLGVGREQIYPELQEKSIEPATSIQTIQPDEDYYGLNKVVVNAVTSEIDDNIQANNIRRGVSILGVNGNLEADKPDQTKTATPTTQAQVITPDLGYELSQVNIEAVTNEIDSNIQASNIKAGVSILNTQGSFTSDGNVIAEEIAEDKIAYANGQRIVGTRESLDTTIDNQDDLIEQLQEEINNKSGISAMRSYSISTRYSTRKNSLLQRRDDNRNSRYT